MSTFQPVNVHLVARAAARVVPSGEAAFDVPRAWGRLVRRALGQARTRAVRAVVVEEAEEEVVWGWEVGWDG